MLYNKQLHKHNPSEDSYGDCHRTAIACILDKLPEEVPNWGIHYGDDAMFFRCAKEYLKTQGLQEFTYPITGSLEDVLISTARYNVNIPYMLTGQSPRGFNHVVVCRNDEIIHDPAIEGGGLVGPSLPNGYYWVSVLVKML